MSDKDRNKKDHRNKDKETRICVRQKNIAGRMK